MKIFSLLFLAAIFASAVVWADDNGPLFNGNELGVSVFGEAGQGNVDSEPQSTVTHTSTTFTFHTSVLAPTVPAATPTPTPPIDDLKAAVAVKKAAAKGGGKLVDPVVKVTHKSTHVTTHDRLEHNVGGGGIAVNYYITRYIGVALEGDFLGGNPFDSVLTSNLIFRYPFEFGQKTTGGYSKDGKDGKDGKTIATGPTWGLAPYVLIGGGCQWDGHSEGIGDVGGGLEFRFRRHYGIFVEGRWIIHDSRESYAAESLGLSYTF
jgi:hypothetical protein